MQIPPIEPMSQAANTGDPGILSYLCVGTVGLFVVFLLFQILFGPRGKKDKEED